MLIKGDVLKDAPEDQELAHPIVTGAFIGKALVLIGAVVHGKAEFVPSDQPDRKRFNVHEPSVDVVEVKVIADDSEETHATAPFYERLRQWIEGKGFVLLPPMIEVEEE